MWRRSATCLSSALLLAGCGGASSHSYVLGVDGRIGPLHVDRSDRSAVVAFAGRPDVMRDAREPGYFTYRALGYGCASKGTGFRIQLTVGGGGPYCRTAFFLDRRSGKLETFFTSSPEYSEDRGVRIGMKQAVAERLLHTHLAVGCTTALYFESRTGSLSIDFGGGVEHGLSIKGARVDAFVVHGKRRDAGIFDCL